VKDLIIIGNGNFAKLLYYYLAEYSERRVAAFSVDSAYIKEDVCSIAGINIVPLEFLKEQYPPENFELILGIGYTKMNQTRKDLFLRSKKAGYTVASFIHPTAIVSKNAVLDEGNIILEQCVIQPFVKLGKGNLIWHSVKLAHDDVIGSFNTFCQNTSIAGVTQVGDNCFLGNSCTVLNRINIADFTLVGAGAVLKRDTDPYEVIVPARSVLLQDKKSTDYI